MLIELRGLEDFLIAFLYLIRCRESEFKPNYSSCCWLLEDSEQNFILVSNSKQNLFFFFQLDWESTEKKDSKHPPFS